MHTPPRILFVLPYPEKIAPSQRFRVEQYFPLLKKHGIDFKVHTFFSSADWKLIYSKGHTLKKILLFLQGYIRRLSVLRLSFQFDYVFIHREATPLGPPVLEWILAKVIRKKLIYDFDDAIWETDKINEPFLERIIRWRTKVGQICRWSYKVSCGNNYLAEYASRYNKNVVLNPTCIDTHEGHNAHLHTVSKNESRIVIGWTGSHSTLKYLSLTERVLQKIQQKYDHVDFMVIADRKPDLALDRVIFKPWTKETEVRDLLEMDIGIMPLPDDVWAKGKCGFKALQYMALEIPCVASPVGVNSQIIQPLQNGFLCESEESWMEALEELINNKSLRERLGKAGKRTVEDHYSVDSNGMNFLSFFQ